MPFTKKGGFNRYEPPSPSTQGDENLEDSFLKDLDKLHDTLPQPFHRIDKVLTDIFELAWIQIEQRESEKQYHDGMDANIESVIYEEELLISAHVNCIELVGNYIFLGSKNNLLVYKLPSLTGIPCHLEEFSFHDVVKIISLSQDIDVTIALVQQSTGMFLCLKR